MYRVEWIQTAIDELALVWILADSASRQSINHASDQIDPALVNDPLNVGESRLEDHDRLVFMPPLAVHFEVDAPNNIVWVLSVWLME